MSTVLLIPGLLSDGFIWEEMTTRLPQAHVADLSSQDSITDMARDCLDRCPGRLRVAGHSMGGRVALEMVRLAPERVERLSLLDTGIHPLKPGEPEARREIVEFAHDEGMAALADRWLPPMVAPHRRADGDLMTGLHEMVLRMDPDLHQRQITALVTRPDAGAGLGQLRGPLLLLVGRDDEWSPVAQHVAMQRLVPGSRLEVVDDAGHFAPVEQPDAVADLLEPFLR